MSTPVRLKEPGAFYTNRQREAYPTNTTGYGSEHTAQQQLTRSAKGPYGGDEPKEVDEDDEDLKTLKRILKKRPELRTHAFANVESYVPRTWEERVEYAAMLAEREAPLFPYTTLFRSQYAAQMNALADVFLDRKFPEDARFGEPNPKAREAARGAFGFGRKRLAEMGFISGRNGWI